MKQSAQVLILLFALLSSAFVFGSTLSVEESYFQYEDGTYNSDSLSVDYSGDMANLRCEVSDNYGGENEVSCSCSTSECTFYTKTMKGSWSNTFSYPIKITDGTLEATSLVTIQTIYTNAIFGCMDPSAINYNPSATQDDGSCVYPENPNQF